MNRAATTIWAMVIAATFFWGSNFNAASALVGKLTPLTAASERFGIAVIIFFVWRLLKRQSESRLTAKDMTTLCVLGLIGVFGFNYAFFTALHTTSALNAALIMSMSPLVTALLSTWLLRTSLRSSQVLGLAIAFIGVALVITGGHLTFLHVAIGDLWMLLACLAWSLYSVLVRKYIAHVPPLQQARWTISAGAFALIALAFIREQPVGLIMQQTVHTHLILIYMAICGTVLAYLFWLRGVQALGPQRAAIAFNLVPVFTLLVNLALGQLPKIEQFLGMALVFCGVLISSGWRPNFSWRKNKVNGNVEI
ncbi:MAG: EamA family transporter [Verrucomicrobiaceae bacterium]|nr:EamA family transporter [Verrucomicrobiaceae bacterium]